jgi:hypothetical protein
MTFQGASRGMMTRAPSAILPYESPFTEAEHRAIEDAILTSVEKLRTSLDARSAIEIDFTKRLVLELNRLLNTEEVPGFSARWLETIPRGGELCSFDGSHVEKRPDMVFRRQGVSAAMHREYCGLFVECKIVDATRTMDEYCGKGVIRFVAGQYAWAMRNAMMLGYARDSYSLPAHLNRHLEKFGARYGTREMCSLAEPFSTKHARSWSYPTGGSPGDIVLRHLWVTVHF